MIRFVFYTKISLGCSEKRELMQESSESKTDYFEATTVAQVRDSEN